MEPPPAPPHQPQLNSPSSSSSPTANTTTTTHVPKAGLVAAQALLNHNRRVESLSRTASPRKKMSIREASLKWGASKTAIARHLKALLETDQPFKSDRPPGRPRALTPAEEEALAAFCVYLAQGNGMGNIPLVHRAANELRARRSPPMGPCHRRWVFRWLMEREDLTLSEIPRADRQYRIEGSGEEVVKAFFDRYFGEKGIGGRREAPRNSVGIGPGQAQGGMGQAVVTGGS